MARSALSPRELTQVLHVLRIWPDVRLQLRLREEDALEGGYCTTFEPRRTGAPGNPTQARALRLATDQQTRQLARLNSAIERALSRLGGSAGKDSPLPRAMRAHYLAGWTWTKIGERLAVSRQTTWRWEQRFRFYVWEQLGRRL